MWGGVRILVKWLNSLFPIGLSFWTNDNLSLKIIKLKELVNEMLLHTHIVFHVWFESMWRISTEKNKKHRQRNT